MELAAQIIITDSQDFVGLRGFTDTLNSSRARYFRILPAATTLKFSAMGRPAMNSVEP